VTATLNAKFSFETFVVGAANRLAVTAGRTVAENPGSAYNPLFVYSGSGLGKTHLLIAAGHGALQHYPAPQRQHEPGHPTDANPSFKRKRNRHQSQYRYGQQRPVYHHRGRTEWGCTDGQGKVQPGVFHGQVG